MNHILPVSDQSEDFASYRRRGGYDGLTRAMSIGPESVVDALSAADLRGRGGAAYPTGKKWRMVRESDAQERYLVVNGAEGEPGSFKDRTLMQRAPHLILEGILIAAWTLDATEILFYINDEFQDGLEALRRAIAQAEQEGMTGEGGRVPVPLKLLPETHVYLAGEETALIRVLMGEPAQPWHRPPYPTQRGYRDMPTVVNNVETLAMVPLILRHGAEWFKRHTPMLFSLSGDVRHPGVYEMALGSRLSDLLEAGGGAKPGQSLVAVLPGGFSMPLVGAEHFDVPLAYDALKSLGSGLGASIIAVDSHRRLEDLGLEIADFFRRTTCGRCPVCVKGTLAMAERWESAKGSSLDRDAATALTTLSAKYRHKGICSFLDTAALMTDSTLNYIHHHVSTR